VRAVKPMGATKPAHTTKPARLTKPGRTVNSARTVNPARGVSAAHVEPRPPRSSAAAVARAVIERMESEPIEPDRESAPEPPPTPTGG
jgi:hypothetical protein